MATPSPVVSVYLCSTFSTAKHIKVLLYCNVARCAKLVCNYDLRIINNFKILYFGQSLKFDHFRASMGLTLV